MSTWTIPKFGVNSIILNVTISGPSIKPTLLSALLQDGATSPLLPTVSST